MIYNVHMKPQQQFIVQDNFAYYNKIENQSRRFSKKMKIQMIIIFVNLFVGLGIIGAITLGDSLANLLSNTSELKKYKKYYDTLPDDQKQQLRELKKELENK